MTDYNLKANVAGREEALCLQALRLARRLLLAEGRIDAACEVTAILEWEGTWLPRTPQCQCGTPHCTSG